MGTPERRGYVHKRAVQMYACLGELLKRSKKETLSVYNICGSKYFPEKGTNMRLIREYFRTGTISLKRFNVEESRMYNQIDW